MDQFPYVKLPLRVEEDPRDGSITIIEADGGVLMSDHSGDTPEGAIEWMIGLVNGHDKALRRGYENAAMSVKAMALTWPKDSAERKVLSDAARHIYSIVEEAIHARSNGSQNAIGSIQEHARSAKDATC